MTLQIGEMTVLQAIEDATGWRPAMSAAETTTGANLRSGPATSMPIVAVLKTGVRIVRLGVVENGMAPVAVLGWVSAELLR
jgi:uncharacterized protein YraI